MSDKIKVKKVTFNDDLVKNINNLDLNIESKNLEIIKEEAQIRKKIAKETESRALNDLELSKKLSNNRSDRISDEIILKEKLTSLEAKVSDLETNGLKSDVNLFEISKEAKYIRDITDAISSKMTEVSSSFTDTQVGNIITSMTNATISGYFENKSNPTNYNNRIIIDNLVSNTEDDFSTILKKTGEFTILGEILKSNSVDYNVVQKVDFFSWVVKGALLFDFYSINFISNLVSSLIYHGKNSLKLKYKEIGKVLARALTSEIDSKFFNSSGAFIYSWLEFESENKIRNILLGFYQHLAILIPVIRFHYIDHCIPNQVEKLRFYCERNDVSLDSKKKIITDFTYSVVSACFVFEDADFDNLIELIDDSFISTFNRDNFMDLNDICPSIVSGSNEAINSKSEDPESGSGANEAASSKSEEPENGSGSTESKEFYIPPRGIKFPKHSGSGGGGEGGSQVQPLKKKEDVKKMKKLRIEKSSKLVMKNSLRHTERYTEGEIRELSKEISSAGVNGNLTTNGNKVNKIKGLDLYGKEDNGSNSGGKNLKIKYLATKPSVIENSVPNLDLTDENDVIRSYIEDEIDNNINGYSDEVLAYSIGYYTLIKFKNTEDEMDEDIIPNVKTITVNKISGTDIGTEDCFDEGIKDASFTLDLQGTQDNINGSVKGNMEGIEELAGEGGTELVEGGNPVLSVGRTEAISGTAEGATGSLMEFSNEIAEEGDQETKLAMDNTTTNAVSNTVEAMVQSTDEEDFQAVITGSITAIEDNSSSEEQKKTLKTSSTEKAKDIADKKGYDTEKTSTVIKNAGGSVSKDEEELSFILLYDEEKFIDIDQNETVKNPNDVPYLGAFTLDTDTGNPTKIKLNTSPNMLKSSEEYNYNSFVGKYKTFKFVIEGPNLIKNITVEIYKSPYIDINDFNTGEGESLNYKIAKNTETTPIYIDSDAIYLNLDYENSYTYRDRFQDSIIYRYDVKDDDGYLERKINDDDFIVARNFKLKFKFKNDNWVDITAASTFKYFGAGIELPIGLNHFEIGFEIYVPNDSNAEKISEINNIILTYGKFNKYYVYKVEDIINVDSNFEFTQSTDVKPINYTVQDVPEALTFVEGGIFNIPGKNIVNTIELNTTDKVVSYTPENLVTDKFFINLVYKVNQPSQFRRFLDPFSSFKFSKELTVNVVEGSSDVTVSLETYEASDGSKSIDIFIVSNSYNKITFGDFDNIKDYFTNAGDIEEGMKPIGAIEKNGNTITSFTPDKSTESDYFQFNRGNDSIAVIFTFNVNVSYKIEGTNLIITLKEKKGDINLSELGEDVDNIIKGSTINSEPIHGTLEYNDNNNISKYITSEYHDDNFYITKDSTQYNVIIEYQKEFEEYVEHDIHNFTILVEKNNEGEFFLDGNNYEILSDLDNREELKGTVSQTSTSNSGMPNYKFVPEGDFEGLTNLYLTDGYYTYYITFIVLEDTARYNYYNVLIDSEIEIAINGNEYSEKVVLKLGSYDEKIYTAKKIQSSRDILSYTDSDGNLYIAEISTTDYIFETVELGDDNSVAIDFKGIVERVTNGSFTINNSKITFTPTSDFENNWLIEYKYTSSKGNWIYVFIDIIEGNAKEIVDDYFIKIDENELGLVEDNLRIDKEYTLASNYTLFIKEDQVMTTSQNFKNNGVIKLEKNGYLIIRDDTVFINNNEISPVEDKNSLVDSNNDGFIIKNIENLGKLQNDGTIIINYTFSNTNKTPFDKNINGKFVNNGTFRVNSDFENQGTVENSGSFESKNRIISFQQSPPNNGIFIKKTTTGTFTYSDKKFVDGSFEFELDFNDDDDIAKRKVVKKEENIIVGEKLEVDYRNNGITNPQHGTVRIYGNEFYYEPYNTKVEKTDQFSYKARKDSPHYIIEYKINITPDKVYLEVDSDEQVLLKDIPTDYSVESSPQKGSLVKDTDNNKVYYEPSENEFVVDEFSLSIDGEIIKFSITIYKINISESQLEVSFGSTKLLDNIVADNYKIKSDLNHGELVELDGEVFYNPTEDKIQTDEFILKSGKNKITFIIEIKREYNLEITNSDFSITEGNELTLNLRLNKPAEEDFSISYETTDDTAKYLLDFNTSSGNVKFNSGDSDQEKSISLKTLDDYYLEDNEKFKIKFTSNKIEEIEKEITILDKKEVNLLDNITSDITIKNTQIFTILDNQDVNLKNEHKIIIEDGGKLNVNGTLFVKDGEVTMESGGLVNVNDNGLINVGPNGKLKATSLNNNGTIENNLGILSFNHLSNYSNITSYGNLRFDNKKVDVNFTDDSIIETKSSSIVPTILPDFIIYDVNNNFRIFDGEIYIIDKNFILPKNFSIFIDSGGELIVNENILLQVDGTVTNEGKITNNGFIIFSSSGNFLNYFILNDGEVTNNGSFYYKKDDFRGNVSGNDIIKTFEINSTNITIDNGENDFIDTTFINLGEITLNGNKLVNNGTFINFGRIIGTLTLTEGSSKETLKENNLLINNGLCINIGLINYLIKIENNGKFINYGYINDNGEIDYQPNLFFDINFENNGIINNIGFIAPYIFFNNHILINSGKIKKATAQGTEFLSFENSGIIRNYNIIEFTGLYNGANSGKEVFDNGILINTGEMNGSELLNFKKIFYTDTTRFNSNISNTNTDFDGNTVNGTYAQVNSPVILDGKSSGDITINDGETYVIDNNFTLLKGHTLTIELGGSLNVNKIFTNDGTITNKGILFNYGNIINLKSIANDGLIENNSSFISHEAINGPILGNDIEIYTISTGDISIKIDDGKILNNEINENFILREEHSILFNTPVANLIVKDKVNFICYGNINISDLVFDNDTSPSMLIDNKGTIINYGNNNEFNFEKEFLNDGTFINNGNITVSVKDGPDVIVTLQNDDIINIKLRNSDNGVLGTIGDYNDTIDKEEIKSVTIQGNVTSIGIMAFSGCSGLENVTIPNSVTRIGTYAFDGCTKLNTVTIPNSVTTIGYWAFYQCSSLETVSIGDNVTSIGDGAFQSCSSLKTVSIGYSVTSIGDGAFQSCSSLKTVSIGDNVTSIGDGAFQSCSSLKNVSIPDSVTSIGDDAFHGCSSLESVSIPDSVTTIGIAAFYQCSNLKAVSVPDSITSIGYATFYSCSSLKTVSIPDSVRSIGGEAFRDCKSLETVSIPDSVTSIGNNAFRSCKNLETVNMSNRITSDNINSEAFVSCIKLNTVNLFENNNLGINETVKRNFFGAEDVNVKVNANVIVKLLNVKETINIKLQDGVLGKIGDYDNITDITQIESVSIKGNVTSIGAVAFSGCTNLKEMMIPDSVTFIGNGAFYNCTSLETLNIPDSLTSIGVSVFYNCTSLETVNIPDSVTSIGAEAFYNCTSISTLDINNALVGQNYPLGEGLLVPGFVYKFFKDSISSIKYITIGSSVTSIGEYAFFNCTSLETVEIPDTVTRISKAAFLKCSSLKEMIIPDSVTSIGETAFSECTSLETLSIPNSVTEIGNGAFDNCKIVTLFINTQLVSEKYNNTLDLEKRGFIGKFFRNSKSFLNNITIGDSVTSIGEQAFFVCPFLKTVSIPDSVKTIGFMAFSGCIRLETVSIPDSVTSIGDSAFEECTSLKTVSMGNSVTNIDDEAFISCIRLETVSIPENNELGIIKTETRDFFGAENVEVIVNRLSFKNNLFINNHIINFKNINLDNNNNGNIRNNGTINCNKAIINNGDIKNGINAEIKVNNKTDSFDESFINCGTIINNGQITLENKKFRNESEKVIRNYGDITTKELKNSGTIYSFNILANLTGNSVIPKYNLTVEKPIFKDNKASFKLVLEPKAEEEISIKYSGSSIGTVYNDNITINQGENNKILEIEIPERKNSGQIYITNFSELRGVNSIVNKDSWRLVSKNFVEVGHTTVYEDFIVNDDMSLTKKVYFLVYLFLKNLDGKLVYESSKGKINGLGESSLLNKNKWEEPIIVRSDFIDQEVKYFIRKAKKNKTDVDKFIKISGETFLLTANNFKPIAVRFFDKNEFEYIINFDTGESISIYDAGYLLLLQSYTNVFDQNRKYNTIESKFSCYWLSSSGEIMNGESLIIGSNQIGIAEQFFGVRNVITKVGIAEQFF